MASRSQVWTLCNCRIAGGKALPLHLESCTFLLFTIYPQECQFSSGLGRQIPAIGDAICKQLKAFEFTQFTR